MLRRHFINVSYSEDIPLNQIWYKTSNGEKFDYQLLINTLVNESNIPQLTLLKKNDLINDDWWCLTFTNNISYTGISDDAIGPIFTGILDGLGVIETNVLNIIEIKLPSISFIGSGTFYGCVELQYITIPNSVTSIGEEAFISCESLASVTIPASAISIGNKAFAYCSALTSIVIGNGVTSIGEDIFRDCSALNSITFEGTIEQWNAVTKDVDWNYDVPATVVHCIDGDVTI